MAELVAEGAPGALALAVVPSGRVCCASGVDSAGHPLQATAEFNVGSITKTFVAALVLALVEDGRLGLDDDATTYLVEGLGLEGPVTVRSLLNHTSGMPDYFENKEFAGAWLKDPSREWDPDHLIEISLALPRREPGTFSYANSNYVLVGLVIESVTSGSVGEALRRRILESLGLSATRLPATANVAGGLVSTANDLADFLAALLSGKVIGEPFLREMLTTVPSDWIESQGYGLGIEQVDSLMGVEVSQCGLAWGHVGLGAATTVAFTTPDASRQIVLMANTMLTRNPAWSAINDATWATLCSGP
ncbi:MAG: serine hydrolase domain-containing protein [Gaiellaceae bacterium]